jgi:protein-disulfide isomerase
MKRSPFKLAVIITLVLVVLIIGLILLNNRSSDSGDEEAYESGPSIEGQPTIGEKDAPVTIVEFGDFKCPACKIWGENFLPQLKKDFVDSGQASFSFVNVLFHGEESKLGSLAAESVLKQKPDAYWAFHDALFAAQPEEGHDSAWLTEEKVIEIADNISDIDTEQLQTDLDEETEIGEVKKDTVLVDQFNVEMTPTIMVNGIMIEDPFDYEEIIQTIESVLEK